MNVTDIVEMRGEREAPVVRKDSSLQEVIRALYASPRSRSVYVVDDVGKLEGRIGLNRLVREVFAHGHEPRMHARALLGIITHESASHIMQKRPHTVRMEDTVEHALSLLIKCKLSEIPIVDREGILLSDLSILDLLNHLDGVDS